MAAKKVFGNELEIQDNTSALLATTVFVTLATATYNDATGLAPLVKLVLNTAGFALAPTAGDVINIYEQEIDMDDAGSDAPVPSSSYKQKFVGSFVVSGIATAENLSCEIKAPLSGKANYVIENATGQSLSAGFTVIARSLTYTG